MLVLNFYHSPVYLKSFRNLYQNSTCPTSHRQSKEVEVVPYRYLSSRLLFYNVSGNLEIFDRQVFLK